MRVCSEAGCPNLQPEPRCLEHRRERDRHLASTTPTKATRTYAERQRRADVVQAHLDQYGAWCPGYQRDPHEAHDLTADHITPINNGGPPDGPLGVLCRSCNSRKAGGGGHPLA